MRNCHGLSLVSARCQPTEPSWRIIYRVASTMPCSLLRLWQLTRCQSKLAERLFHMTRVSDEISPFDQARPPLGSYLRNGAEPFEMRGGTRLCASANHYHCHLLAKVAPKMRLAHLVLFEHREPENFNCRACAASVFCSMGLEWEIQCYGATGLPFLH